MLSYLLLLPVAFADKCMPIQPQYGDVYQYNPAAKDRSYSSALDVADPIWSPEVVDKNQWMEIAVPQGAEVVGLRTQGRTVSGEWVSSYRVLLKEGFTDNRIWYLDTGNAIGNDDASSPAEHQISLGEHGTPFTRIRIIPEKWHTSISLNVSLLLRDRFTSGQPYPTKVPAKDAETFSGVGLFRGEMRCTAFYIETPDVDGAYALSAGHCTQDFFSSAGVMNVVAEDKVWPITFKVDSNRSVEVSTVRVEYATMQGMDVSLLKLNRSKTDMSALGIHAFPLASAIPEVGAGVKIVGVPQDDDSMEQVACQHLGVVDIGERFASWERTVKNNCAGIREGFSGSPMIDADGKVFAVVGTTSIGAISETCAMGNPCEITSLKPTGAQICNETNYGAQAVKFNGCFAATGFNSSLASCPLQQKIGTERLIPTRIVDTPANNKRANPNLVWQIEVPSGWSAAKYKQGLARDTDCAEEANYSESISIGSGQPLKNVSMIDQEGLHRFCLVGQKEGDGFQHFEQSTYFVTYVDKTVPTRVPLVVTGMASESMAEPVFEVPELVDFKYYLPKDETDNCSANTTMWRHYMRFPFPVDLHTKHQAPLCLQSMDYAGHWTPIYRYLAINDTGLSEFAVAKRPIVMV